MSLHLLSLNLCFASHLHVRAEYHGVRTIIFGMVWYQFPLNLQTTAVRTGYRVLQAPSNMKLHATYWVWLVAMFTFSDPPRTRDGHVSFEFSLLHGLMTVFVRTSDDFEKTSFKVSLFVPQFPSPFAAITRTFDSKGKDFSFCRFI